MDYQRQVGTGQEERWPGEGSCSQGQTCLSIEVWYLKKGVPKGKPHGARFGMSQRSQGRDEMKGYGYHSGLQDAQLE